jgi:hypothetical protein
MKQRAASLALAADEHGRRNILDEIGLLIFENWN